MLPNLLGNVLDWRKVYKCQKYNLVVIEDSADTIGYSLNGKNLGKFQTSQQTVYTPLM